MVEAVRQGWQWMTGSAPRPDRRSTVMLGVGALILAGLLLGLSMVTSGPATSALPKPRTSAQAPGALASAPNSTAFPGLGSPTTATPSQVASIPATTTTTTGLKITSAKAAHSHSTRKGAKAHRSTKRHGHGKNRVIAS